MNTPPRFDFYTSIHKALRAQMADTLLRLGAMDADDGSERERTLDAVLALLAQMRSHLEHENRFAHTAIEARLPGGASRTTHEHREHLEAISNLEDEARALRDARPGQRAVLAIGLYRHLGAFIAENLDHMLVEERENNAALWATHTDAELMQLHDTLVASIPPEEMANVVRWFVVALPVAELVMMFADMQAKAPPPAFDAMFAMARAGMDAARFAKLERGLGLPTAPGLIAG